jgi:hypothetical protein
MVNFRVVTSGEARTLGRRTVWYVERRADDGHLGIVGLLFAEKADADATARKLNDKELDRCA